MTTLINWVELLQASFMTLGVYLLLPLNPQRMSVCTRVAICLILLAVFNNAPIITVYQLPDSVNCKVNAYRNT